MIHALNTNPNPALRLPCTSVVALTTELALAGHPDFSAAPPIYQSLRIPSEFRPAKAAPAPAKRRDGVLGAGQVAMSAFAAGVNSAYTKGKATLVDKTAKLAVATQNAPLGYTSDKALAVDAAAMAVISAGICTQAQNLPLMSALVPAVIAARFVAWNKLSQSERGGATLAAEMAFFAVCTAVGAFNDWNSVVNHKIYDYTVTQDFPEYTTIPVWMLTTWGMILRSLATLLRWERVNPPAEIQNKIHLNAELAKQDSPWLKIGAQLMIVAATRQMIYHHYLDPWLSWIPFAIATPLFMTLFKPDKRLYQIAGGFLLAGTAIESLYIKVGGLHQYHLGWLGGVPLWIALWWSLSLVLWDDLSGRMQASLQALFPVQDKKLS